MTKAVLVFLGGGVGALARYGVQELSFKKWGGAYPLGTLIVNISGAFLIGFLMTIFLSRPSVSAETRVLLVTGLLGGYTTFSALTWETIQLFSQSGLGPSFFYVLASFVGGVGAVAMGVILARNF